MHLSTKFGFAYLSMHQCDGAPIEKAIEKYCNIVYVGKPAIRHINARAFSDGVLAHHRRVLPDKAIDLFCLICEPFDWAYGWYRHVFRMSEKRPDKPAYKKFRKAGSFEGFISAVVSDVPPKFAKIGTQTEFLSLRNGEIGVDYIFRYGDASSLAAFLSEKIGEPVDISFDREVDTRDIEQLPDDLRKRFKEKFADDYSLYRLAGQTNRLVSAAT